ncbi:MAG: hypothetical protein PWQ12_884 [Clostridiales bacterium]|jgi:membrane-associated phospholipid phosphatase|nr:hypothetical protein [Clostridiales bacterium]
MDKIKHFLSTHRHLYAVLWLIPILIWFRILEVTLVPEYTVHTWLDSKIPFVPAFVIPYVLWFPYIGFGVVYTGIHSKKDFYKLLFFLGAGMSVAYIIYMIFPNAQDLRPEVTGTGAFSALIRFIYTTDTPTNVCPSVHVINAIAVDAALRHVIPFSERNWRVRGSFFLMVLICLSTLFIKQHSVLDVVGGVVVGMLFYVPLYEIPRRRPERTGRHVESADL